MRLLARLRAVWHRIRRPLTAGVRVIVVAKGQVLLIRHSYIDGWHLPGGGVGRNETYAEAARRETREEVGVDVETGPQPFAVYGRFRDGASDHVAVFVARSFTGTPRPDGVEILEAAFFALDDLPPDTTAATRRRLDEYRTSQPDTDRW